jgi:glycosyltransferase involved in cell wall biosynthesis
MDDKVLSKGERVPEQFPTALYAGRLIPWKGVSLAIRAVALKQEWRLLICGDGPDTRRLQRLARELRVEDRVSFLGLIPRVEMLKLMSEQTDVFIFPSLHDEAPWVVAEAVTLGIPVVCLDLGGPPVLTESGGTAVPALGTGPGLAKRLAEELDLEKLTAIRASNEDNGRLRLSRRIEQLEVVLRQEGFLPDHAGH